MVEPVLIEAEVFWAELERAGVGLTDKYSANGAVRYCKQRDGELFTVSVHEYYPQYMITKVLKEHGFMHIPMYNSFVN